MLGVVSVFLNSEVNLKMMVSVVLYERSFYIPENFDFILTIHRNAAYLNLVCFFLLYNPSSSWKNMLRITLMDSCHFVVFSRSFQNQKTLCLKVSDKIHFSSYIFIYICGRKTYIFYLSKYFKFTIFVFSNLLYLFYVPFPYFCFVYINDYFPLLMFARGSI